jgi:1-deoxyxylulose-5-phosphate synthase
MAMQYRVLGPSGVRVSALCLGTAAFGVAPLEEDVAALVHRAVDAGINFFDTANSYGNQGRFDRPSAPAAAQRKSAEELLGKSLRGLRHDVIVSTMVQERVLGGVNGGGLHGGGLTRRHIVQQVELSLRRLQTDYIDVYHAHHPDPTTPVEQSFRAFDDLIRQGKVRYVALSGYSAWELTEVLWTCDRLRLYAPVCHQVQYSLVRRESERDVLLACQRFNLPITAASPLGGGVLAGAATLERPFVGARRWGSRLPISARQRRLAQDLDELSRAWGHHPAQVALAWLLAQPNIASAVVGPECVEELNTCVAAVHLTLTPEQLAALDGLGQPG